MSEDHLSNRSRTSATSSFAARKRAKAEAARARLQFARIEFDIMRERAKNERIKSECDAHLKLLEEEKEAAAAEAEANALEDENSIGNLSHARSISPTLKLPAENAEEKTRKYVASLYSQHNTEVDVSDHQNAAAGTGAQFDFTKFLLKKDLLLSRLTVFNEQPESFEVWRNSFSSVMKDLDLTPQEELDLLVKNLGPESSKYAYSLRSSNPANPQRALQLLWERLDDRYGSPEQVESCLKTKLERFPQLTSLNKDSRKLYELCDILDEIQCAKENPKLSLLFALYDSSAGVNSIVCKLPHAIRQKWITQASNYKQQHGVPFPPFTFLVEFLRNVSKVYNDPAFRFAAEPDKRGHDQREQTRHNVFNRKSTIDDNGDSADESSVKCPIHKTQHSLTECKAFRAKSWQERKTFLKDNNICYKCLSSNTHIASKCSAVVKCGKCDKGHLTAMHREPSRPQAPSSEYGGEGQREEVVKSKCTRLCGDNSGSRSCGKVILVHVFPEGQPERSQEVYAIIDDQSNRSLAAPSLFNQQQVSSQEVLYTLSSCAGQSTISGRRADRLCVQSHDGRKTMRLPPLLECANIPNDRTEIPTPEVAQHHPHLRNIAHNIPQIHGRAPIALLIGRDLPEAHHVTEQVTGPPMSPFAQCLPLGWVIVGDVCLNRMHKPSSPSAVRVNKTSVTSDRGTIFEPCTNDFKVTEADCLGDTVFQRTKEDEKIGLSVEDKRFLDLMDQQFQKNDSGRWSAPLPFRSSRSIPMNNRSQAVSRAHALDISLKKDPVKKEHSSEEDVKNFVSRDFYIDDGVTSLPQKEQAVSLIKRTQADLMEKGEIRLHKYASNDRAFLQDLSADDLCAELHYVDLSDRTAPLPVHSCLGLPYLDEEGLLRVGGRLCNAKETMGLASVHPVILPKNHHVSTLLVRHYHKKVKHKGRHFTEGALRSNGFWIIGAKRLVQSIIQQCFLFKRTSRKAILFFSKMQRLTEITGQLVW
ncbi:uncharacterized protein [Littorina saxatilis]|uniref:Uncharacterized protein n=1 Tax=Littorina saxatilis TaxID=31220 RepID=A0AAN9G375_9CAEN